MADAFERIRAARAAAEAALGVLTEAQAELADAPERLGADRIARADAAKVRALEGLARRFEELGDPVALEAEVAPEEQAELRAALEGLARVHAVLTMTFARDKDALRDRLLHATSALRELGWHAGGPDAGARCDVRG